MVFTLQRGKFRLKQYSRRQTEIDEDQLSALIYENNCLTIHELVKEIGCSHMTVTYSFSGNWAKKPSGCLSKLTSIKRFSMPFSLPLWSLTIVSLEFNINLPWHSLSHDEKWCLYSNMKKRKEWLNLDKQSRNIKLKKSSTPNTYFCYQLRFWC